MACMGFDLPAGPLDMYSTLNSHSQGFFCPFQGCHLASRACRRSDTHDCRKEASASWISVLASPEPLFERQFSASIDEITCRHMPQSLKQTAPKGSAFALGHLFRQLCLPYPPLLGQVGLQMAQLLHARLPTLRNTSKTSTQHTCATDFMLICRARAHPLEGVGP